MTMQLFKTYKIMHLCILFSFHVIYIFLLYIYECTLVLQLYEPY